jgi:hypothetical protein
MSATRRVLPQLVASLLLPGPRSRLHTCCTLISPSADFTLKMEVICSSETSVHIQTTRRYISEDGNTQESVMFKSFQQHSEDVGNCYVVERDRPCHSSHTRVMCHVTYGRFRGLHFAQPAFIPICQHSCEECQPECEHRAANCLIDPALRSCHG